MVRRVTFIGFFLIALRLGSILSAQPERTHVTVLSTTDLHGHIHPVDYYTNQPANHGLAKISTLVSRAREIDPDLILIDSGNNIQGTPLAYHSAVVEGTSPNPMMAAMNALRYDAMTPGNHEYNFGCLLYTSPSPRDRG